MERFTQYCCGAVLVVGLLAVATWITGQQLERWRQPARERFGTIAVGEGEEAVRARLGKPFREYSSESAPDDYYVEGYGRRERSISHKVLIYLEKDMIFYVWINQDKKVEEFFIGTS